MNAPSALITGAGQGLGRALALCFARAQYRVAVCDVNAESAACVAREIREEGGIAIDVQGDVSDREAAHRIVKETCAGSGGIDVLVNNAAVRAHDRRPFWEIDPGEWDRFMAVNVRGTWLMMRASLDAMRRRPNASIINISSSAVLEAPVHQVQYITSKAAVIGLTRAAARELGPFRIRVNAILPSSLTTEIPKPYRTPEQLALHTAARSLPRPQTPDDVVGVALFLASDASRYMTGQSLNVDGGASFL